jgi:hypothetical protein
MMLGDLEADLSVPPCRLRLVAGNARCAVRVACPRHECRGQVLRSAHDNRLVGNHRAKHRHCRQYLGAGIQREPSPVACADRADRGRGADPEASPTQLDQLRVASTLDDVRDEREHVISMHFARDWSASAASMPPCRMPSTQKREMPVSGSPRSSATRSGRVVFDCPWSHKGRLTTRISQLGAPEGR